MRKLHYLAVLFALAPWVAPDSARADCGASNPNCIVPTAPVAANNNQAASTAFVVRAIGNVSAISALTGDGTATGPGSVPFTLANVNPNIGSFGSATQCVSLTVNAKGLITAASAATCAPAFSSLTGAASAAQIAASPASHAVPIDIAGTPTWAVIPNCIDSVGQHINYTQSSDAWSCGTTTSSSSGLSGNNIVRNAGLGLTTQVGTVLVGSPPTKVTITGWSAAGAANGHFVTSGGNAGLQPGKLVAILGPNNSGTLNFTATVTGCPSACVITSTTSVFTQSQGDLFCVTGGTNTSPRTCYRVNTAVSGTVLDLTGGLVNEASKTFVAIALQGGYPGAVDATVNGMPAAGNPNAPAFFYYPLQVTAVGTNFFNAQLAGYNGGIGTTQTASAYEVTNGNQGTGCIAPDWWSCTSTVSYYKMRGTDWDGTTVVSLPGAIYSAKLVKGATTEEFFWQDLAASAPDAVNLPNPVGVTQFQGKTLTCGAFIRASNANQGRIYLYDGSTRTYSPYVTAGSLQWVEVVATLSASATAAQYGISLGAGSIGDSFIKTQPICKYGNGTIGVGNYLPAPPTLHAFTAHTNPFYYINQAIPANTYINIEQETSGCIPSGMEMVHADIGGMNTNALSSIYLADAPGPSPQMSAVVAFNPSTASVNTNQTGMVAISRRAAGDGLGFYLDTQAVNVGGNAHWTNATIDYLGGIY